jgi:hypothetical protein
VHRLKVRSCLIDGEATLGVSRLAFDLLELDGEDLRRAAFETRKATVGRSVWSRRRFSGDPCLILCV